MKKPSFSKQHLLLFILVFAAIGGYVVYKSLAAGVDTFTANVFVVPANYSGSPAASANCSRKSTPVTFANAAGSICAYGADFTSWDKACDATAGGDIVGVMPGTYKTVGAGSWLMGGGLTDCAKGAAPDYDPNYAEKNIAANPLTNWVKFMPVSLDSCPNINFSGTGRTAFGFRNFHMIIEGSCFNFNRTIHVTDGGGTARPQNMIFRGDSRANKMNVYGLELIGPKNFLLENIDYGPNVQCAANDANATPAYFRCDPNGPYFEAPYANFGTNSPGCAPIPTFNCAGFFAGGTGGANEFVEPYIHGGAFGAYTNIRLENFKLHDGQAKGTGSGVHPGCFMFDGNKGIGGLPAHNFVLDAVSCERQVIGIQASDSGVTIQNSYFACSVLALDQTSPIGRWDVCSPSYAVGLGCINNNPPNPTSTPGCTQSNVLIRYNVFLANPTGGSGLALSPPTSLERQTSFGSYNNVRIIGNIFMNVAAGCNYSGVTCANNAFGPGVSPAGTNATTLTADPLVDGEAGTPDDLWRETTQVDPHLNGNVTVPSLNPFALGLDYQLNHDADRNSRSSTSTFVGSNVSPSQPNQKIGDLNNDGAVNILDLSILLSNYGKPATATQGDINGDGNCTILDLSILLSNYGT